MLAQQGLLDPLSTALMSVVHDTGDEHAAHAQRQILQMFLVYSQSDAWMKKQIARRSVLRRESKQAARTSRLMLT